MQRCATVRSVLEAPWFVTCHRIPEKKSFFFEFWAATAIFLHEQALFCLHAWASVWECGLGLGSGSRQHMPDTALWGPAFIPSCFHSPTFGRCAEKVFSQVFTFQEKKSSICFCTHLDIRPLILIPDMFQPRNNCNTLAAALFLASGQANKLQVKLYRPRVWSIYLWNELSELLKNRLIFIIYVCAVNYSRKYCTM